MSCTVIFGICHLYLRGSCLRMSRMVEMAYSPVSSVRISTKAAPLPAPDTAENTFQKRSRLSVSTAAFEQHLVTSVGNYSNLPQATLTKPQQAGGCKVIKFKQG